MADSTHKAPPGSKSASFRSSGPDERKLDKKLGQMLIEKGRITGEQLIRAIQSQRALGGRLGTCLLEMEVLGEEELLDVLAEQLRVPPVGVEDLRVIEPEILEIVPKKMAHRFQAVPFALGDDTLEVATLQVRNLGFLDELRYLTDRRVIPHIANEVRIFEALQKHYQLEIPRRYHHLLDRLNRARFMWDESAQILLGDDGSVSWTDPDEAFGEVVHSPSARRKAPADRPGPARPDQQTASQTAPVPTTSSGGSDRRAAGDTWPAGVLSLEQVDHLLDNEGDPSRVAEVVLRYAAQSFSRSALFQVRKGKIYGWMARGEDVDKKLFRALEIPLAQPSLFLNLSKGTPLHLGALPPMPAHRQLALAWGGDLPSECLMIPIRVRGNMVSVLYGDRGPLGLHGVDVDLFRRLAARAAEALELCILRKKIKTA